MNGSIGSRYSSNVTEVGADNVENDFTRGPRLSPGGHHDDVHDDPIGSMPLLLMLLLAMGYGFRLYRKSRHPAIS